MVVHMDSKDSISALMAARGLSVNALAEATAIPRVTLTRRLAAPSSFTLNEIHRVATALHVSPTALVALAEREAAA